MSKVTVWKSKKYPDCEETHEDTDWHGRKFGHLTVVGEKVKKSRWGGKTAKYWTCLCDCGRLREYFKTSVLSQEYTTCENTNCEYYRNSIPLTISPAIVTRLEPKYLCTHPAAECTISSLCKICCHECDRPCKSCNNTPDKCGAKLRKK